MKIDLSTVALILMAVLPGYCAFQIRNLFSPRTFAARGPTEELASFSAISVLTHAILAFAIAVTASAIGFCAFRDPFWFFNAFDHTEVQNWLLLHKSFGTLLLFAYIVLSCIVGAVLGIPAAIIQLGGLKKIWGSLSPRVRSWLKHKGILGLLGERPIIYDAFTPPLDNNGNEQLLFVEAELKGGAGFYTGQVANYAVLKDEEPHKLILLQGAFFKPDRASEYQTLSCDRLLLDLADVLVLQVRAHPDPNSQPQPQKRRAKSSK